MVSCSDRQLAQSDRVDAFSATRAGVVRAVRPFTGDPSGPNLMDYLNREVFPSLKANREKLNEIFLQVADNAPSANPLSYYFSTNTAAADPTSGRIRLDNATQNAATTIRLSELNSRLVSAVAWLDVMQGSVTTPIGVVTLQDAINPGRFVRYNLNTMTDQGTYWDLGVTPVESSHVNPFVDGEAVVVSFIAGVATGGATVASSALGPYIRAVSAGTQMLTSGTLSFSNANGLGWGLSGQTLTGSYTVPTVGLSMVSLTTLPNSQRVSITAATDSSATGQTLFLPLNSTGNSSISQNNVFFRLSGNTLLAAAALGFMGGGSNQTAQILSFANSNGLSWTALSSTFAGFGNIAIVQPDYAAPRGIAGSGASTLTNGTLVFSNLNGISFGLNGSTMSASYTVPAAQTFLGAVAAGTQTATSGTVVFSNSNNVSFTMNGSTQVVASASFNQTAQTFLGAIAGGTQTATSGTVVFSDSNNISFGLSGSTRMTASFQPGVSALAGGTVAATATSGQVLFANSNGVSFGMNGQTMTASVGAGGAAGSIAVPGTTFALGQLVFSNSNGLAFGINGSTLTGSYTVPAAQTFIGGIAGGTQTATSGTIVFSNSNNVSFGLSGSTRMTAQAFINVSAGTTNVAASQLSFADGGGLSFGLAGSTITMQFNQQIGLVSHVGGNSVANVSRIAFSNASNVTFSLSTAANAATLLASVAAAAGGGVNIAGGTQTATSGTVVFSNSNGISFGLNGSTQMTASYNPLAISAVIAAGGGSLTSGTVVFSQENRAGVSLRGVEVVMSNSTMLFAYDPPRLGPGQANRHFNIPSQQLGYSFFQNFPYFFPAFAGDVLAMWGHGASHQMGEWRLAHTGNTQTTAAYSVTYKLGLYSVEGSTGSRLILVNSASVTAGVAGGSFNSTFGGGRDILFQESRWSVNSGLTHGHWYLGLLISQNPGADTRCSIQGGAVNNIYSGIVGQAGANTRKEPFMGFLTASSAGMPGTLVSSDVFTATSALASGTLMPGVSVRANMNAGFK